MARDSFTDFILAHADDDTARLLFACGRYPGIDLRKACTVIEARRKAKAKLPTWFAEPQILYPSSLALEQCSSETTALYKQRFVPEGASVADITGGLGVDSSFFARKAASVTYIERNPALCEAALHNFEALGLGNVKVVCAETCAANLPEGRYDLIFADPARRSKTSSRVYDIADCEPDILQLKDALLEISEALLVKISPMADITRTLLLFPEATELHIVSSDGEVKELLVYCRKGQPLGEKAPVFAEGLRLTLEEEAACLPHYAPALGKYIFVPAKGLLKAGAFKLTAARFGLSQLAPGTHLYTADSPVEFFPGRTYELLEAAAWSKSAAAELVKRYPAAELTAVNFPLSTDDLRKRLRLKDGGTAHIFATTFKNSKFLLTCKRFSDNQI